MHITSFNEAGDPVISGTPNMRTLQTLKIGLDQMLDSAAMKTPQGTWTGEAKQIIAYRKALLDELKALNPHYAEANRIYGGPMEVRRAIEFGREMPRPSERYADTLREYADMPLVEQHGARIGYADVVRGKLESGGNYPAILRDKSPKGQAEIAALAGPEAEPLRRYLGREQRMKEGDIKIRGGSSTMGNVADVMSTPSAADVLGIGQAIMTGSPTKMVSAVAPHLQMGASERQRVELARRLMMQDPAQAARLMDQLQALEDRRNRGLRSWFGWGPGAGTRHAARRSQPVLPAFARCRDGHDDREHGREPVSQRHQDRSQRPAPGGGRRHGIEHAGRGARQPPGRGRHPER